MKSPDDEIKSIKNSQSKQFGKMMDWVKSLHNRIEALEAARIEQDSKIHALWLCLRDFTNADQNTLVKRFEFYKTEVHQKLLEKLEDYDPYLATKMDKRPGSEK